MTKYSIKNICLGIGIGLVLASMANIAVAPKSLTIDEIKKEAAKSGLIVMDTRDLIQKQPEQEQPAQTQENTAEIKINTGTSSEEVAKLLLDNKLINNKQEFLTRLAELKKESKIKPGSFIIPKGASIDNIIEIVTALPK